MKFKITFNSPVVLVFTIICLFATILNIATKGVTNDFLFSTSHTPLTSFMTYLRSLTHVFGHADFEHFLGNAAFLLLLGPILEEKYGGAKLTVVMIITAIITAVVNYIFFPGTSLCGASGIVFAFILMVSFTNFKQGEIPVTFILVALIYIGQEVYSGLTVDDNVSNLTHIVGGIVGAIIGYEFGISKPDSVVSSSGVGDDSTTSSSDDDEGLIP
ncbi:MAG: rhomboid family intramembrane serine protease [Lachnospiraceae bacterium]|nr:rhomboid family intramembrane serine protease [Lachnospiraceae bacterium]